MVRHLLRRVTVVVSVVSMLFVPTDTVFGQDPLHDGAVEVKLLGGTAVSACPDPQAPTVHCRDEGQLVNATIDLSARRPDDGGGMRAELRCLGTTGDAIPFRARQDSLQGRGFVGPATTPVELSGILQRNVVEIEDVLCSILVADSSFHRVGTAVHGRLRLEIEARRVDTDVLVFRNHYCARFTAKAVPILPQDMSVTGAATGRVDDCGMPDPEHDVGRTVNDDPTGEHG